jgi:4'-phosphopantetheinyl transferase
MCMKIVQAATEPEVFVAFADLSEVPAGPVHMPDALRVRQMPAWRAREFLGVRGLLRMMLAELEPAMADAVVGVNAAGAPVLEGWPGVSVSLSHDTGYVAAAVGRCPQVGVDVQTPPDSLGAALLQRCLGRHATRLNRLGDTDRSIEFTWVWTAQEACVKAQGMGLAGRPWEVDIVPGGWTGQWGEYAWHSLRAHSRTPLSCAYGRVPGCAS